jgi:hypothetical protein
MSSCDDENKLGLHKCSEKLGIHMVGFLLVSTILHIVLSKRPISAYRGHSTTAFLKN